MRELLEDVVFARDAAFVFPAIHFPDFFAAELEPHACAAAVLGDEHDTRGFQRGAQTAPGGFVGGRKRFSKSAMVCTSMAADWDSCACDHSMSARRRGTAKA